MNKTLILVAILISGFVVAQEEPVPSIKLSLKPGTECITTMRFPGITDQPNPPPMPSKRTFLTTGDDASQSLEMSNGRKTSEFVRGEYYLAWDTKLGAQFSILGDESVPDDFRSNPFPELNAWVKTARFRQTEKMGDKEFYLFEGDGGQRLLVDMDSLLPVRFETIREIYTYSYKDTGAKGQIPLPAELQNRWDALKANVQQYLRKQILN